MKYYYQGFLQARIFIEPKNTMALIDIETGGKKFRPILDEFFKHVGYDDKYKYGIKQIRYVAKLKMPYYNPKCMNNKQKIQYLLGLMDGNGSFNTYEKFGPRFELSGTKDDLTLIKELIDKLIPHVPRNRAKIPATIRFSAHQFKYIYSISGARALRVYNLLEKYRMGMKMEKAEKGIKEYKTGVREVAKKYYGPSIFTD